MAELFIKVLNISMTAGWLVLAVVLVRLLLKKAPKWVHCLLWSLVALRLVIPYFPESDISLLPSAQVIPQDIAVSQMPAINTGIPAVNDRVNPVMSQTPGAALEEVLFWAAVIWLIGAAAMALYSAVSYLRLKKQVRASILCASGIYDCDDIDTPFILGFLKPKIYMPSGLFPEQREYVTAHEKAHLKRRDHWWKPVGFGLLTVYWFNPVLWLAYILLCRDIEKACDEKVIRNMDTSGKRGYSEALVACSLQRRLILACPLAFGEVAVKDRIKAVLHYKKPAFWVVSAGIAACAVTAVCFLTNPKPCVHSYEGRITLEATCTHTGKETLTCTDCWNSYTRPITMLEHTYRQTAAAEPTCTTPGCREYTCTGCGAGMSEQISCLAHTFGTASCTKEPNCTEKGEMSATCSMCQGVYVVEYLETNGVHGMKNTVLRAPTCTDPGEGTDTCIRCGKTETVTYKQEPHDYKEGIVIAANCAREGSRQIICTDCGKEQWYSIPKNDSHSWRDSINGTEQCIFCGASRKTGKGWDNGLGLDHSMDYSDSGNFFGTGQFPEIPSIFPDPSPNIELPTPPGLP